MKNIKKIRSLLAVALACGVVLILPAKGALAAVGQSDIENASYTFFDGANITGDFGQTDTVDFLDTNSTDGTRNYVPQSGGFCDPGDMSGKDGKIKFGVNIDGGASLTAATISSKIKLGYKQGVNCTGVISYKNIVNTGNKAASDFQWNGNDITSLNGSKTQLTFTRATGVSQPLYLSKSSSGCGADGAILLDNAGGNTGNYYQLLEAGVSSGRGTVRASNISDYPRLQNTNALNNKCFVASFKTISLAGTSGTDSTITGSGGQVATDTKTGDACYLNSTWSLAWIACPALEAASTLAQSLINVFEGQLSFSISDLSKNNGQQNLKTSWTIFKDIASAIFVILMLVMVLSEAISFGPFDAYTVKKMLPRLIIAVIFMQLSWAMLSLVVDIFNDIGKSLADLMYLPFKGTDNMQFGALLANAHVTGLEAGAVGWGGLIAGIGTAAFAPFSVLMASFLAVIALLVGLATLIFRKILIMGCIVFAPIAMAAWILPGTKKYYDMWYSNFTKSLMMFPLVVGLVAAGRIFAYISGTQDNGVLLGFFIVLVGYFGPLFIIPKAYKWGGSLMQMAGNGISSGLNKSVGDRGKKWIDGQRAAQKEWKARDASKRLATGEYTAHGRFGSLMNRSGVVMARKGMDRMITGTTPVTETNRRKFEKIQEQAEAYRAEDLKKETARLTTDLEGYEMGDHDKIRRAILLGETVDVKKLGDKKATPFDGKGYIDAQKPEVRMLRKEAAFSMAAQMGGEQHMKAIDEWSSSVDRGTNAEDKVAKQRLLQHNVGQLFGKMPHLYKTIDGAATEPPETIAGMSGTGIESIVANLSTRIANRKIDPGDADKASKLMDTFLHNLSEAAANENLRGRLNQTGLRAARAYVASDTQTLGNPDGSDAGSINSTRRYNDGTEKDVKIFKEIDTINPAGIDKIHKDKYEKRITNLINPDGSINRSAENTPIRTGAPDTGDPGAFAENQQRQQTQQTQPLTVQQTQAQQAALLAQGQATNVRNATEGTNITVSLDHEALAETLTHAVREGIRTANTEGHTINPSRPEESDHPRIIRPGDPDFHNPPPGE